MAAWLGRLLLLAVAVGCFVGPTSRIDEQPLNALGLALGTAFLGVLMMTFRATSRAGQWLVGIGLWTAFTGFGVIAFVDPASVITDSQGSTKGVELESDLGAYVFGASLLAFGNLPLGLWWWSRRSTTRTEDRIAELIRTAERVPPDEDEERRRRERRTRKSRRKRKARRP